MSALRFGFGSAGLGTPRPITLTLSCSGLPKDSGEVRLDIGSNVSDPLM